MSIKNNLLRLTARTGKLVDTAGNIINEADGLTAAADRDIAQSSRDGKLFRAYWEGSIPAGTTYDFIVAIPAGREIYGISRSQAVNGNLDINFLVGGTGFSVVSSATGYNFDETIGSTSVCTLDRVTGLTGASQRAAGFVDTGGAAVRVSAAQTEVGAHPKFDNTNFPVFRYSNLGGSAAKVNINLVWQEIPV